MNDSVNIHHRYYNEFKSLPISQEHYSSWSERRFFEHSILMMDSQTKDPTVSQGCCLAVIRTNLLHLMCYLSIRMIGMAFPSGDFNAVSI
jgi:hypothetical protein